MTTRKLSAARPSIRVELVEAGERARRGWVRCELDKHVYFTTEHLESYCFAGWEPVVFDAMVVAAGVEFADRTQRRSALQWEREIELSIPVHDPARWNSARVSYELHNTLEFLTGDSWHISFYARNQPMSQPRQGRFSIPEGLSAVMPFSDGLDSRAVAGLMGNEFGDRLIRIRLGSKTKDAKDLSRKRQPFTSVPYKVQAGERPFVESTARSRGFKFALISGLAAHLAKVTQIIVSESGQGSLGPALVAVGQGYKDFRSHPLFTHRMEKFIAALLSHAVDFRFPRIWHTKAETLKKFYSECVDGHSWSATWSCWQQNRQVSVDHQKRQCGICAACFLRRMSVHASGLEEKQTAYVWEDLTVPSFEEGAAPSFAKKKITKKMREYAIAGLLHLDHLAGLQESSNSKKSLVLSAFQLSRCLALPESEARNNLGRLLRQHQREWGEYVRSLGPKSFVADWATRTSLWAH